MMSLFAVLNNFIKKSHDHKVGLKQRIALKSIGEWTGICSALTGETGSNFVRGYPPNFAKDSILIID